MHKQIFDVLVVGNGSIGLSSALALSIEDPNLKIGVIGPLHRPGNASIAAGAMMLGCFGEVTKNTLQSEYSLAKLNTAFHAAQLWDSWIGELNNRGANLAVNRGTYIILNSESSTLDNYNYDAIIECLKQYNESFEELANPLEIPGLNPVDNYRPLRGLYIPKEGFIDSEVLLDGLQWVAINNPNITIIDDFATKLTVSENRCKSIETKNMEQFTAKQILLCTGSYTQILLDQVTGLNQRIPKIMSGIGCSFVLSNQSDITSVIRTPNRTGGCGLHAVPRQNSHTYIGASNYVSLTTSVVPKIWSKYYLLKNTVEQINKNFCNASIAKWYVGNRPVTIDLFPLIGETSIDGLWMITGTYRDGLHNSPLLAQFIAKKMLNKPLSSSLAFLNKFTPERTPIITMSKTQAIKEFANSAVNSSYEHGVKFPQGWHDMVGEMFLQRTENIYNRLEIEFGIPPEIIRMIDRGDTSVEYFRDYYKNIHNYCSNVVLPKESVT